MKNFSAAWFFLLAFCSFATAQSSFLISEDSISGSVSLPETTAPATIKVTNLTNETISINWRRYYIVAPTAPAVTQVCDPNQCYEPQVTGKTFLLEGDSTANMIVYLVTEEGMPANTIVRLKFTNTAQPADTASTYYFLSIGTSSTKDQASSLRVKLYPNPVTEAFSLDMDQAVAVETVRMYSATGQQVAEFAATPNQRYSLAGHPAGTYFVALADKTGKVLRALQVVKE